MTNTLSQACLCSVSHSHEEASGALCEESLDKWLWTQVGIVVFTIDSPVVKKAQNTLSVLTLVLQSEARAFQEGFRQFSFTAEKVVTKLSDKYCYLLHFSSPNTCGKNLTLYLGSWSTHILTNNWNSWLANDNKMLRCVILQYQKKWFKIWLCSLSLCSIHSQGICPATMSHHHLTGTQSVFGMNSDSFSIFFSKWKSLC